MATYHCTYATLPLYELPIDFQIRIQGVECHLQNPLWQGSRKPWPQPTTRGQPIQNQAAQVAYAQLHLRKQWVLARAADTCSCTQSSICAYGRWKHPLLVQIELCVLTHMPDTCIEPSSLPSCWYAKLERLGTTDLWRRVDLPAYITHINLPAYTTHINSYWSPDSTKLECSFYDISMKGLRTYPSLVASVLCNSFL